MADARVARSARNKLWSEIFAGRITRATHCEVCGFEATVIRPIHAHHDDYAKPLDVRWFCGSCHKKHHIAEAKANGTYRKPSGMVRGLPVSERAKEDAPLMARMRKRFGSDAAAAEALGVHVESFRKWRRNGIPARCAVRMPRLLRAAA